MSSSPPPPYPGASSGPYEARTPSTMRYALVTDRANVRHWHGGIVVMHAAFAAVLLAAMVVLSRLVDNYGLSTLALLPLLILLVGQTFQLSFHCYLWGARSAISRPVELDAGGVSFNLTTGYVRLPWEAVLRVDYRSSLIANFLVFRLHPAVEPGMPGVLVEVSPRQLARIKKSGVSVLLRGLRQTPDEVRAMVTATSGGRFRF